MKLALYKHKRKIDSFENFIFRITDDVTKFFTKGDYSHCELVFYDKENQEYICYSSSNRDGGVRRKSMKLPKDRWDFIELSKDFDKKQIEAFFDKTQGLKYDFWGACGVILGFGNKKEKWFCSEWCARALNLDQPHKFSPVSLAKHLIKQGYKLDRK